MFAGSGTSLVEASFLERVPYAIDFDPLSQIITKSKVNYLTIKNIKKIKNDLNKIVMNIINPLFLKYLILISGFRKNIKSLGCIIVNINKYKKKMKIFIIF